ncbi:hypothetical protein ZWY2020_010133 [Hordeum vulgare]|nr:hypothetical protein ZWY2020_010133 [Hordeum vulgare]
MAAVDVSAGGGALWSRGMEAPTEGLAKKSTEPTNRGSEAAHFSLKNQKMDSKQKKLLLLLFGPEEK